MSDVFVFIYCVCKALTTILKCNIEYRNGDALQLFNMSLYKQE